jgi:fructokinase
VRSLSRCHSFSHELWFPFSHELWFSFSDELSPLCVALPHHDTWIELGTPAAPRLSESARPKLLVMPVTDSGVIVCGEALVDLMPEDNTGANWRAMAGGSPFNTALALARLQVQTQFLGRVGNDGFGRLIRLRIARTTMDDRLMVRTTDPTTLAVVNIDHAGNATYHFYWDGSSNAGWRTNELPAPDDARPFVHVGSLAAVLPPSDTVLLDWFRAAAATSPITYDLNVRPAVLADTAEYRRRVARFIDIATVVKASEDDARHLYPDRSFADVAADWFGSAPRLDTVIFTAGGDGSRLIKRDASGFAMPTLRVDVVDTVGAGDTFMAGYLQSRFILGEDESASLRRATVAGALVCTRRGAEPPTAVEVNAVLEERGHQLVAIGG